MIAERKAYAKINLTLQVRDKREDGYHEIVSVMARATLCDKVEVQKNSVSSVRLKCTDASLECEDNLCAKAVKGYFNISGIPFQGVDVTLEKRIPLSAGLGGGSADAAAVIECMEELFQPLEKEKRHALVRSLGADVPYCLEKTP